LGGFIVWIYVTIQGPDYPYASVIRWEAAYISASTGLILLGVLIFGVGLVVYIGKIKLASNALRIRMKRTLALVGVTACCMVFKVVYLQALNEYLVLKKKRLELGPTLFAIIWFFYFLITEVMPSLLMLILITTWPSLAPEKNIIIIIINLNLIKDY